MKISLDSIEGLPSSERQARAYAYLSASMKARLDSSNDIRDLADCVLPFVASALKEQSGDQLRITQLQNCLKLKFGFDIPIYTLEYLVPRMTSAGLLDYNSAAKIYRVKETKSIDGLPGESKINIDFDRVERSLKKFAASRGIERPMSDRDWPTILIDFLKGASRTRAIKPTKFRGSFISDPEPIENYIVAEFVRNAHSDNDLVFSSIQNIFYGVIVETFISDVQSMSADLDLSEVSVFYDTSFLMRLLGTSDSEHTVAAKELHRDLQSLGANTYYLEHNFDEVSVIFEAILANADRNNPIFGETGEAIANGDISIARIRELSLSPDLELARQGVVQSDYGYAAAKDRDTYQIDEEAFINRLRAAAQENGRAYKIENLKVDASSLALIMRMRGKSRIENIERSKSFMITPNVLFAKTARKYLVNEEGYYGRYFPAIATTRQVSAIAWLSKAREIDDRRVTRELITSCYEAVRPDSDWFTTYLDKINELAANDGVDLRAPGSAAMSATIRKFAQSESYGSSILLRGVSFSELWERAEQDKLEAEKLHKEELSEATAAAAALGGESALSAQRANAEERYRHLFIRAFCLIKIAIVVLFFVLFAVSFSNPVARTVWAVLASLSTLLAIIDWTGPVGVRKALRRCEEAYAAKLSKHISQFTHGEG